MEIAYLPASDIACWLPFSTSPFFIEDYYGNYLLYPSVVPLSKEYKQLNQAITRAQLRRLLDKGEHTGNEKITSFDDLLTVSEQGITVHQSMVHYTNDARESIMMALDGLEPSSTAFFRKETSGESYVGFGLALEGMVNAHEEIQEVLKIQFASGNSVEVVVHQDSLLWCMAEPGQDAVVEYLLHHFTIDGKKQGSLPIVFGEVGLVIDSRGRPFDKPQDNPQGKERVSKWLSSLHNVRLLT